MCGILGSYNFPREKLFSAISYLRHRGPDEEGEYSSDNLFLYHVRLAIQDISSGHQPFHYLKYTILFNGEIYNHFELRGIFDLKCSTRSDTETLIQLYNLLGKKALDYLDGMFAFAIYNRENRTIFLARDRAGEKPLYYYYNKEKFAFSSEINAIVKCCGEKQINDQSVLSYLRYSVSGITTPYENYFELRPGTWLEYDLKIPKITLSRWWDLKNFLRPKSHLNLNEATETIDILLHKSIKNQLTSSDLEVATFLSGGIDSGLVTSIAADYNRKLKTFTVAFEGAFDESPISKLVAERYSTDHHVINISFSSLKSDLPKIIANYGEPYADSSSIPSFYVSKETKKHVTVALTGDGADELFGGYRRYVPFRYFDFLNSSTLFKILCKSISGVIPLPQNKQSNYNYIYRLMDFAGKQPLEAYLSSTYDVFEGYEDKILHGEDNTSLFELRNDVVELAKSKLTGLEKIMLLDFNYPFNDDLLVKMDIAAMSNSLETRAPFLSKEILKFAASVPDIFKINGKTTKYLLRSLGKKYLPTQMVGLPKRGFEVPLKKWIENDLKEIVNDYLNNPKISNKYIEPEFLNNLISKKIRIGPEKRAKMLWSLLCLEIWHEQCFKGL